MRKQPFLAFALGVAFAFAAQPLVIWAQVVGIPRIVQNLTVRGVLTLSGTVSSDAVDLRVDSLGVGVAAPGTSGQLEVAGSTARVIIDNTDGTELAAVVYQDANVQRAAIGMAADTNDLCAGSVQGDLCIRFESTNSLLLSADGGSTSVNMTPASGTFTLDFANAYFGAATVVFDYQRIGNLVIVTSRGSLTGTSDVTTFISDAAIPAALRPSSDQRFFLGGNFQDNGTRTHGCAWVASSGQLLFINMGTAGVTQACETGGTTWQSTGTKTADINGMSLAWMLGNP